MLRFFRPDAFLVGTSVLLAATGCGGGGGTKPTAPGQAEEHADHDHGDHDHGDHEHGDHEHGDHEHADHEHADHEHADHEHAELGPHGGQLIELGDDEYHAELLHDEQTHTVTIYVLDGKAAETVPISAPEVAIQLNVNGEPQRFALAAVHLDQEKPAQAVCFEAADEELSHALDEQGAKGTLTIDINGREFTGPIVHRHSHEHEHEHSHADEPQGQER